MNTRTCLAAAGLLMLATPVFGSAMLKSSMTPATLTVIGRLGRSGGGLGSLDALESRIVAGTWTPPRPGDSVALAGGKEAKWEEITPGKDGAFEHPSLSGGYACWNVSVAKPSIAILEASGHSSAYVNGEPRIGDVYSDGFVRLPVMLRAGGNCLLFKAGRGRLSARLVPPAGPVELNTADSTLPDLIAGERVRTWGAVVVINASEEPLASGALIARLAGGKPVRTKIPAILPMSVRKVGFRIEGAPPVGYAEKVPLNLSLTGAKPVDVELRVRKPGQTYKRTFVSGIDGSVQYFAVNPAQPGPGARKPALALSLHGASVQAIGQADAYGSKSWLTLVAPTNRRPYGYDWEDWGRMDAMEVLAIAQRDLGCDPARTYLIGHSMGGHGTWQLGVLYPDRFAAIAPSAGWISAYTYAGVKTSDKSPGVPEILARSAAPMDTLSLVRNTAAEGVYILHGTGDDNVPVTEARRMRDALAEFHRDFVFHEEPGQGHWWDLSDEPGADCVDWAPMWDFLAKHNLPPVASVRQVDFITVNPGVSSRCRWAAIEAQTRDGLPSEVHIQCDPQSRRYKGTTVNVARLALELTPLLPGKGVSVEIDGQKLSLPDVKGLAAIHMIRVGDQWRFCPPPPAEVKNPARYGPFRAAFDHRFQFVYGTRGTPEEVAWAFAKARYDAETFWYRGNGSVDVVPDTAFDTSKEKDRSVILYGNSDTNTAWKALLGASPVQVRHEGLRIGEREEAGGGLACLFLQPRPGSAVAFVAAVSGTGLEGLRLTNTLPYLQPMAGFPDVLVVNAGGVRAAGFFGADWSVATGEIAWQEGSK